MVVRAGGGDVAVEVKRVSTPGLDAVRGWSGRIRRPREPALLRVLVADRVTQPVRERLRRDGFGWLDLRGHLRLVGGGVFIDSDVTAQRQRPERSGPLAGQAGLEVACWLLMHPTSRPGVREIAAHLGRAPSTVSEILKALRARDLVTSDGLADPPELFTQVADRWRPTRTHLAALPPVQDPAVSRALGLDIVDPEASTGWAISDTVAAAAYGAPVAARTDHPVDFYVPNAPTRRRAVQLLGTAATARDALATAAVAPVPAVCADRVDPLNLARGRSGWPLAHPLFVALDLAQDPGRGNDALRGWTPPKPWTRVW